MMVIQIVTACMVGDSTTLLAVNNASLDHIAILQPLKRNKYTVQL